MQDPKPGYTFHLTSQMARGSSLGQAISTSFALLSTLPEDTFILKDIKGTHTNRQQSSQQWNGVYGPREKFSGNAG